MRPGCVKKPDTEVWIPPRATLMKRKSATQFKNQDFKEKKIFLTTKVWVEHYGYDACRKSVEESLKKLKTDYLDLLLLHQPFSDYYGAWHALEDLYKEGTVRAIGVSNFYPDRLVDIASFANIRPIGQSGRNTSSQSAD